MSRFTLILLSCLLLASVATPALAGGSKSARNEARDFSRIARDGQRAIDKAVKAALKSFEDEYDACAELRGSAPQERQPDIDKALRGLAELTALQAALAPHSKLAQNLGRVGARDKRLKAGGAAALAIQKELDPYGAGRYAPCPYLDSWRANGWAKGAQPDTGAPGASEDRDKVVKRARSRIRTASRRMRKLGVSKRSSERFARAAAIG